ncbi:MAG: hypothetical protein JSR28_11965 [Proteobacteria bacterium]|nr:hypothetical protein [Pseudomonadota bacterium]
MNMPSKILMSPEQMSRTELLAAFHSERSRCLDAFASVEECVVALLDILGLPSGGEPFGHKLKALRQAKASPKFSKARLEKLGILIPSCVELNQLRNDIVHSRLQLAEVSGEFRACFTNTKECLVGGQSARLFTLDGLARLSQNFTRLAVELKQVLINPASLPQPPSPGAAGDP